MGVFNYDYASGEDIITATDAIEISRQLVNGEIPEDDACLADFMAKVVSAVISNNRSVEMVLTDKVSDFLTRCGGYEVDNINTGNLYRISW